ncbi:MAG TPA: DNA internalization-related competence protein ComEC/Rec2 [Nitrospiraceae bacterium]|nr:DNA internalization-related competence protein ComEC/Rec2 [Nitrospiraceae bacterium]
MLPSLTVAFLLGLVSGSQIPFFPVVSFGLLAVIAIGLSLLERAGLLDSRHALILYASLLSGVFYWSAATPRQAVHQTPPNRRDINQVELVGLVTAPVQHGPGRQTVVVEATEGIPQSGKVRLVWREPGSTLHQGDRIAFRAKVHPPSGSLNPGGFDYATYLERQGIDLVATITGPDAVHVLESGAGSWRWLAWNRIDRWRAMIRDAAIHTLDQPALGIFLGIVIGERGFLQQELQEWFMVTGTVHLLSISGSHLGLVALVVFWMGKRLVLWLPAELLLAVSRKLTPSRIAILLTWPTVALYALLAGAELATIRSLVMITLALVAVWLGHDRHLHHAMAVAALLIVVHDPRAIYDISFQLSFLSVLVIVQTAWWLTQWHERSSDIVKSTAQSILEYGRDALLMSGAVTLATLPVVAIYFNQVPWLGVLTNLIAIPFTGFVLVPLGLLAAAWTVLTGAGDLVMGRGLEQSLNWMVQGLRWCAGVPGGEWHIAAPAIPAVVLFYAGLLLASASVAGRRLRVVGAGLVLLLACWWVLSPRWGVDGDRWRVTFLDVGQGDSAVIELPDGQTVLIDGGARYERFDMGRGVVAPFLWNRGIRHLDHVVGTHQQLDHVGGLIWILRHLSVGQYWGTGVERSEQFVADLRAALNEKQRHEQIAHRGDDLLRSGPCRLMILNPSAEGRVQPVGRPRGGTSLNDESIVSRLQCGAHSILFGADIEVDGLRRLSEEGRQPVTLLKVPHHGARSSLDRDWIRQIRPQYAVISVGRANPYGHPVQAVLQAYAEQHVAVSRTDLDGAVWVTGRLSRSDVVLTRMRELIPRPVEARRCFWSCEQENWHRLWLQFVERDGLPLVRS